MSGLTEELIRAAAGVTVNIKSKSKRRYSSVSPSRIQNLVLSDLHFGSRLNPEETTHLYDLAEQQRRLDVVINQAIQYKADHRDKSKLFVHILGDVIQNNLHDPRDGAPLAEQIVEAITMLTAAIGRLSTEYKWVEVYCVGGNHDRNKARHQSRAVNQKWDSLGYVIYNAIKIAMAKIDNVKFIIPKTPFYTWQAFNKSGFACHGDTVLNVGNPGKSINVEAVRRRINELNVTSKHDLFMVGHIHCGSLTILPNGVILLTNGALTPPDEYALSLGIMGSGAGQWLFESVENHIVGDSRFILV